MGMITRVRGRLRSLHNISKIDPVARDEKIAETVCLLSILFLLPYFSRGHSPLLLSLGGWCVASYSFLVLPVLISANYKYQVRWIKTLLTKLPTWNQVIFFILCDFFLNDILGITGVKTNKTVVMALTTILFYAVFGYFATRIRDIFLKNRIPTSLDTSANCLKLVLKLVLEWAKTFVIILCIREQGIQYSPHPVYTFMTLSYYLCSEKIFCEILGALTENVFTIEYFENLEYLYVPMFLNVFTIAVGVLVNSYLLIFCYSNFVLMSTYFIIFLRTKDAYCNYWQMIVAEKKTYSSFRVATDQEISDRDDICAVCLNKMSKARITPCNHLFHPVCLKQCLKNSFLCPLCKYNFRANV